MSEDAYPDTATAELFARYVAPNYGRFAIDAARGEGCVLWDEEGRRYLDFGGGVAVNSLGHAHPAQVRALGRAAEKMVHCSNLYRPREQALLAAALAERVVGFPGKCFFCNSGAEANEALIKLARRFGEVAPRANGEPRREIVTFTGSFHGRTTGGMAATAQAKIKAGFGPLMPGFKHLPFNDVAALRAGVGEDTVGVLLEPVQGEGGIHVADLEFLGCAADLAREHDLLLMFDEIQCGLGRCGEVNGWQAVGDARGIVPDAISWAKGLGGGFPIGATWFKDRPAGDGRLCDLLGPGSHGSTYGGSPLASTVGLAVVETILDEGLPGRARELGERIVAAAEGWGSRLVREVRGRGLMLGFVLDPEAVAACDGFAESGRTPALFVIDALHKGGLLTVPAGTDVVRWLPPLTVSDAEVAEALERMEVVLAALTGGGA